MKTPTSADENPQPFVRVENLQPLQPLELIEQIELLHIERHANFWNELPTIKPAKQIKPLNF